MDLKKLEGSQRRRFESTYRLAEKLEKAEPGSLEKKLVEIPGRVSQIADNLG